MPMTTIFLCPLMPCQFKTTKDGMKDGEGGRHLKNEHRLTGAIMKTSAEGTYKFTKVKLDNEPDV